MTAPKFRTGERVSVNLGRATYLGAIERKGARVDWNGQPKWYVKLDYDGSVKMVEQFCIKSALHQVRRRGQRRNPRRNPALRTNTGRCSMMWPTIFDNPGMPYHEGDDDQYKHALADQLTGWTNCEVGSKPPPGFGEAMARLTKITGAASPEDVLMAAQKYHSRVDT